MDITIPSMAKALYNYIKSTPLTFDDGDADSVLELLYNAYVNTQGYDPDEVKAKFDNIEECLSEVSLDMNNYIFAAVCDLCMAFEKKGFMDGIKLGSHLILELRND